MHEIKTKAHEDQCILRTPVDHDLQCSEIEGNSALSKEYGINSTSNLNELNFFHVSSGGLLPDIMHDILEGALAYESKIMLERFIRRERYFQLADLNHMIENFQFGYTEVTNRPTIISNATISGDDNTLKQNASQSWLLGRYLPLMIGEMIPEDDEHWMCFTLLLNIMQFLFAPKLTEDDLAILQDMIMEHHQTFVSLYPDRTVIPKQHYLIHTPRLIHQYGPLLHFWTMRFEAKHKYFKRLTAAIGNFINLPYTLAMRHQFLQCYLRLESSEDLNIVEVGKGVDVTTAGLHYLFNFQGNQIYCPKWVTVRGVTYKKGSVMAIKPSESSLEDHPVFGGVEDVYVMNSIRVYLYVKLFDTLYFSNHYVSYIIRTTQTHQLVALEQFLSHLPLHAHKIPSFSNEFCVVPKFRLLQ